MTREGLLFVVILLLALSLLTVTVVFILNKRSFERQLEAERDRADDAWDKVLKETKDDVLVEGLVNSVRTWRKQVGDQFLTTTTHDAHIQLLLLVDKFEEDLRGNR